MSAHSRPVRFLILLCLVTLQLQLLASSAMACRHADARDDGTSIRCPLHAGASASQGADKAVSMLDCQKCALGWFLGGYHQMASYSPLSFPKISRVKAGSLPKHFYHFVPDQAVRPPISSQS